MVIAVPPSRLGEIQQIMPALEAMCVPTRVILDLGVGVSIRDKLFDFWRGSDVRPSSDAGRVCFVCRF